ncbi:BTAD domain-containing putative transcriptional regulator [Gordonia alkanivorans]|nr:MULTISPECIES: BTAD domain-containing putative transcriptional regulator [Gordonia]GAA14826.1 putative regulatory protein [Gordonia alkanivorans NBRC 16433]MDH3006952.1 BTAD domain-containing putative transcriptional regulator [Gordonia alkanivorans]MDH3016426.1 BTAD domain-containing putative transcriptional regulator [Gordonia alkanivorans]MDH3020455.1 BTAD domain-containing putative transcriptional regulator [Gordonia alkanivorans]MDH3024632.1 BTAD domain-containing putative transcription
MRTKVSPPTDIWRPRLSDEGPVLVLNPSLEGLWSITLTLMLGLSYTVLGGLGAQIGSDPVELGTRKQRATLAQLVLAEGAPLRADRLIEGIWGDSPPDRAEVSLQSYISGLRKALEPDRKPRSPSTVLLTHGTGYSLPTTPDQVDLRRLTTDLASARTLMQQGDTAAAAPLLQKVLESYRPILPEFEGLAFRDEAADHLDRMLGAAREMSFEARMAAGDHHLLVTELDGAVKRSPLDEGLWVLLATALYRLGRQSDALGAIAGARRILADEIGVDPGPRLRELERDILDHAPHLDAPAASRRSVTAATGSLSTDAVEPTAATHAPEPLDDAPTLVGRTDELAALHRAVLASMAGHGGVVVVEGEPGAGKTALIDEAGRRAAGAADLRVLWGRCVDDPAAPSMWPWVQILGTVLPQLDPADRERLLDSSLGRMVTEGVNVIPPPRQMPDAAARFQFYDQAADLLDGVAETTKLIIVLDDLQWADGASLELFAHMASRRTAGVTFFASLRSPTHRPVVASTLATLARLPEHRRIHVGPLRGDDISELIRRETQQWPEVATVSSIERRTGGNAFFVRELARILADRGSIAGNAVPSGVRDVVRQRLLGLSPETTELLDIAALIGTRVDLVLLATAAGRPVDEALDTLEPASAAGVVDLGPADPFGFSFSHDIIREAIADGIPSMRARRIHLAIADALAGNSSPHAVSRVARHLWSAGPLADRERTTSALLTAGDIALRTYDFDGAKRHFGDASTLARATGDQQAELRAIATQLAGEVSVHGYFAADPDLQERARTLATTLGDRRLLASLDYARCAAHIQVADAHTGHRLANDLRVRAERSDDPVVVHLGMQAAGIDEFTRGNYGAAHRILETYGPLDDVDGLRDDQLTMARGFRAWAATVHLGRDAGRTLFASITDARPDPRSRLGTAIFAVGAAATIGDAEWALHAGQIIDSESAGPLAYLRRGGERMYWWARAMAGDIDDALVRIDRLETGDAGPDRPGNADRPRTGDGFWLGLHAEILVTAGKLTDAAALLDQADDFAERTGEHYGDAHRLLVRARYEYANGRPASTFGTTLGRARATAVAQEAKALVERVDAVASAWGVSPTA